MAQRESFYGTPSPLTVQNPSPIIAQRAPTTADTGYFLGQLWVYTSGGTIYGLSSVSGGAADWEVLGGSGSDVNTLQGDTGGQILPLLGNITLTGGTGIATVGSGNAITFNVVGGGLETIEVVAASALMVVNTRYLANNAGLVTLTLPAAAAVGDMIIVTGKGAGGWQIAQNAGQTMHFNATDTTTGVGGSLASTNRYNSVTFVCSTANTDFVIEDSSGVITIV